MLGPGLLQHSGISGKRGSHEQQGPREFLGGGEEEGEKEEGCTGGQKPQSLLPSCARAAWHRGKEKGAKLEAREGLGYSPGNSGARSPGHPCQAREGKRINHPGNNLFFKADSGPGGKEGGKNKTKQKYLDISPHPPRKKKIK